MKELSGAVLAVGLILIAVSLLRYDHTVPLIEREADHVTMYSKDAAMESESRDVETAIDSPHPKHVKGPKHIKYVALIAERHSGSTWMVNYLRAYFADKDIWITSTLCTWKHWFQDRIHEGIQKGERSCAKTQQCPACHDMEHTLVVAMWRNPYDWIVAMSEYPHHAKAHMGLSDDMNSFLTKRWMLNPEEEHIARQAAVNMIAGKVTLLRLMVAADSMRMILRDACVDNFLPSEVLPCARNNRNAIYELDPDGNAYKNVYELRKAKIADFNAVRDWAPYYELITYEDMLMPNGLNDWLRSLETKYGLVGNRSSSPTEEQEARMRMKLSDMYFYNSKHCMPLCKLGSPEGQIVVNTLHSFWDDELEASLGYTRVSSPP